MWPRIFRVDYMNFFSRWSPYINHSLTSCLEMRCFEVRNVTKHCSWPIVTCTFRFNGVHSQFWFSNSWDGILSPLYFSGPLVSSLINLSATFVTVRLLLQVFTISLALTFPVHWWRYIFIPSTFFWCSHVVVRIFRAWSFNVCFFVFTSS